MSYQTYSLTRVIDGDHTEFATSFTTSDDDAINCAHMLAAGFNTMSRNFMGDFVLGVVDTKTGSVQYDGKIEPLDRPEPAKPGVYEQTFKFEPSVDADTILTFFGNGDAPTFTAFGKVNVEPEGPYEPKSKYEHIARSVLEDAYAEMQAVKSIVEEVGVETIPLYAGVREMQYMIEGRDTQIADLKQTLVELAPARDAANEAARAELIAYVKTAYAELFNIDCPSGAGDRFSGVLDVLARFLVVTGEADADEGHAVARRLCGVDDE